MKKRIAAIMLLLALCMSISVPAFADDSLADPLIGKTIYGKTEQQTYTGKNLLNQNSYGFNNTGCTVTVDGEYLLLSGTTGMSSSDLYISGKWASTDVMFSGTYTITVEGDLSGCMLYIVNNKKAIASRTNAGSLTFTGDITCIFLRLAPSTTYNGLKVRFMMNEGNAALPFEPYTGGIPAPNPGYPQDIVGVGEKDSTGYYTTVTHDGETYRIDLQQPLYAGDTAQLNKLVDGEMHYIETHTKKMLVLDGTEDWILSTDYGVNRFLLRDTNYPTPAAETNALCTHYTSSNWALTDKTFFVPSSYAFYFHDDSFATVADWKNFLAYQYMKGTPVTIVYELAEPAVYTWPAVDTGAAGAPGSSDLDGSEVIIQDAAGLLDSVFDYLPQLNTGVLGFMAATTQLLPDWFVAAITISLILGIFIIFLRFLWQ